MNEEKHLQSTTTGEEDLHSASQRQVNLIWERTQAGVAWMIVATTCVVVAAGRFYPATSLQAEWWTIVGLVIGFYFGRTNHQRIGGVQLGR
jgi:hypothetical protein